MDNNDFGSVGGISQECASKRQSAGLLRPPLSDTGTASPVAAQTLTTPPFSLPCNAGYIGHYSRQHLIAQIMVCVTRNHAAFRQYLERSLDVRLRQITEKILPA